MKLGFICPNAPGHLNAMLAQFQQKIPRTFRSLPVTGRVPQRLKPGVENQSEWLASYAEVFAATDIDFDHVLG